MNRILADYPLLPNNEDEYQEEILQLTLPRLPSNYMWLAVLCTCSRHQVHFPVPIEHPIHHVGPSYVSINDRLPIESDLPIRLEEREPDAVRREYRRRRYFQHIEFQQKEQEQIERRRRQFRYLQVAAQQVVNRYEQRQREENEEQLNPAPVEAIPGEVNWAEAVLLQENLERRIEPMNQQINDNDNLDFVDR
ncbi:hypothetical protein HZH66_014816 [Vespula vulgaris]|uniref:Uncharacterized protein n=1 Tax=Vespula vulgaris TaxID=7454 RepID=A0A834MNP7_VESVU|nr:hypothetical protein HZH66_014816 [Vespula vulgaris]